jgi:8-oxo-dGTP diphosphatase
MSWVTLDQLEDLNFPAANQPIIRALSLPDRLLVTPEPDDASEFLSEIELILRRGVIKLVLFRARSLEKNEYYRLTGKLTELASTYDAELMLYSSEGLEQGSAFAGRHLTSVQLMAMSQRDYDRGLLSAACHNLQEIQQANRLGVDFILLSPVQRTLSHPDARPLGWANFQALVDQASMPVYALGGLSPQDLALAKTHGAQGIAAIRSLWNDPAP